MLDPFVEVFPFNKLHGDEGPALGLIDFVDTADIRVTQRRGGLGFSVETLAGFVVFEQVRGEELEGDRAFELAILGLGRQHPSRPRRVWR